MEVTCQPDHERNSATCDLLISSAPILTFNLTITVAVCPAQWPHTLLGGHPRVYLPLLRNGQTHDVKPFSSAAQSSCLAEDGSPLQHEEWLYQLHTLLPCHSMSYHTIPQPSCPSLLTFFVRTRKRADRSLGAPSTPRLEPSNARFPLLVPRIRGAPTPTPKSARFDDVPELAACLRTAQLTATDQPHDECSSYHLGDWLLIDIPDP